MTENRNKLYIFILLACSVGYIWIYLNIIQVVNLQNHFEVCFLKRILNIPCPSCGTTRAITAIFQGEFQHALYLNPLGYILLILLIVFPVWIVQDFLLKKQSFLNFYKIIEKKITHPYPATILGVLVLMNWIWNITKEL